MLKTITLILLTFSAFLTNALAADANPCGTPAGAYSDNSNDQSLTRIITRFRKGDHYAYAYSIEAYVSPEKPYITGGDYSIELSLDGKTAVFGGYQSCTTANGTVTDGRCLDPGVTPYGDVNPGLFFFAQDGDHLNVWEGQVKVLNPSTSEWEAPSSYRFESRKFADLKFE